jgi:CAAX prenyl protease-like protein
MLSYLVPFLIYLGVPYLASFVWKDPYLAYAGRVLLTLPALVFFMKEYKEIKIEREWLGIPLGVLIILMWIGLDPFYPKILGEPGGFDPRPMFKTFLILKFIGMVIVAPWIEELFFRSFFPRYLQAGSGWKQLSPGTFTPFTFISTALIFGFVHHQWLPGILMGFIMNWLYWKTKNLWPCIAAHAAANLILWAEAVRTQNWMLW